MKEKKFDYEEEEAGPSDITCLEITCLVINVLSWSVGSIVMKIST